MESDLSADAINAIKDLAQEAQKPHPIVPNADGLLFVPATSSRAAEIIDLDKFGRSPIPRRKKGTIKVFSVLAFNTILLQNQDAGEIVVYIDANMNAPAITAVLNDHGKNGPGHRDFRCAIEFRPTVEWQKWKAIDGKMMPQAEFAEFIEENISDVFEPTGANMLEIVTYLTATRTVDFKSALNLSNGNVQFNNSESLEARVSAGQLTIPTEFTLQLAPIQGSEIFKVPARFRYRLREGKLTLGLKLLRMEDVMAHNRERRSP
jgi:uncharacterized protein YfdQ (DUF2303 family)